MSIKRQMNTQLYYTDKIEYYLATKMNELLISVTIKF